MLVDTRKLWFTSHLCGQCERSRSQNRSCNWQDKHDKIRVINWVRHFCANMNYATTSLSITFSIYFESISNVNKTICATSDFVISLLFSLNNSIWKFRFDFLCYPQFNPSFNSFFILFLTHLINLSRHNHPSYFIKFRFEHHVLKKHQFYFFWIF